MKKLFLIIVLFPFIGFANDKESEKLKEEVLLLKNRLSLIEKGIDNASSFNDKTITNENDKKPSTINSAFVPNVKIGGRAFLEVGSYNSSGKQNDETIIKNHDSFRANIRSARITASGNVHPDIKYTIEADFAKNTGDLKKLFIDYTASDPTSLRIGKFIQDFGMFTNDNFPEGNPIFCLSEFNEDAIRLNTHGNNWYTSVALASNNHMLSKNKEINKSKTLFLRGSIAPVYNENYVIHSGASYAYHVPKNSSSKVRLKQSFETKFLEDSIDTKDIDEINYMNSYGLDLGFIHGPFSVQSEFIKTKIARLQGLGSPVFKGGYIQFSYSLTGEKRNYDPKSNSFFNIVPFENFDFKNGKLGAWELAFRHSIVDLDSKNIKGGKMINFSSSLNWYLNPNVNIMFNYIRGRVNKNGVIPRNKSNIYLTRLNVFF